MLRNLMEEKQLDFNQPFLSVRRFSSPAVTSEADNQKKNSEKRISKLPPLPFYKSELKSGPIRNAGTVPFVWEKTPGEPKDERKSRPRFPEQPPVAPRPPPGRVTNIQKEVSISTQSLNNVLELDKLSVTEKNDKGFKEEDIKSNSGSEDSDVAYLDALDTLSRSESFSMTCSVSGVSGIDGPDVKPSGTFSADPQTRDFMMGRFLPAAKAMASETPQYAPKKQPAVWDRERHINKVNGGEERRRPPYQYQPNNLPSYAQELRVVESDNESDIFEGSDIMSAKVCGLFPRFCLTGSFCLMNPVPGVKMQSRFPASSVRRVRSNRSSASSCSEIKVEHFKDVVCEQTSVSQQQQAGFNKVDVEPKRKTNEIGYQNRTTHSKLSEENGFIGVHEKGNNSRQSGYEVRKSRPRIFREFLADKSTEFEIGSEIPVVEKTLYVDSVHKPKSPSSNSSSSDVKSFNDADALSLDGCSDERTPARPASLESVDSCSLLSSSRSTHEKEMELKDGLRRDGDLIHDSLALVVSKKIAEEECFDSEKCHDTANDNKMSTKSNESFSGHAENHYTSLFSNQDERKKIDMETPKPVKMADKIELIDLESKWIVKLGSNEEKPQESFLQMTLSLPSPKSPSESWLKRALPVASSRNSRSSLTSRIGISSPMELPLDPKWETIVKTSNVQQGRLRFSEEHLSTIPEA